MLVIIIVSWNVRDLLRDCLRAIQGETVPGHEVRVIVVDNASTDGSAGMVRREFADILLVANTTNRGFTGGNNDGLRAADSYFINSDPQVSYVLLLNPDTKVQSGALAALTAYADGHPDVGLVGPQLLYADGGVQSSRRRFIDLTTACFESTWLQPYAPPGLLDRYYMKDYPDDETCDVDWVYGAAMLVRRSAYLQCGILDEKSFFMYSEEMDWCKRLKSGETGRRWRVVYLPSAKIVHYEARSSNQVSALRDIHFNTSKVRYFHKHHGPVKAQVLRIYLLALFAQQTILEGIKYIVGHKRVLRRERVQAYLAVLRSGLR